MKGVSQFNNCPINWANKRSPSSCINRCRQYKTQVWRNSLENPEKEVRCSFPSGSSVDRAEIAWRINTLAMVDPRNRNGFWNELRLAGAIRIFSSRGSFGLAREEKMGEIGSALTKN